MYDEDTYTSCGDAVNLYLRDIGRYPLLTKEEEQKLLREYKENNSEDAKQKLINSNLRLVVSVAKRYKKNGVISLDLIQEGNIGLMIAIDKYDTSIGCRLSTYATWWIRQTITRHILNCERLIRIPVRNSDYILKYNKFVIDWQHNHMDEPLPDLQEIASAINVPVGVLVDCLESMDVLSLNMELGEDGESTLGDFIGGSANVEADVEHTQLAECLSQIMQKLTDKEHDIIKLRYGLEGARPHTLAEVGEKYGVSRERVRQIENRVLRKLKTYKSKMLLQDFLVN